MAEKATNKSRFSQEKLFKEDSLLPYKTPKLRKYGKVRGITLSNFDGSQFDGSTVFSDVS